MITMNASIPVAVAFIGLLSFLLVMIYNTKPGIFNGYGNPVTTDYRPEYRRGAPENRFRTYDNVESFTMLIGHGGSGHSIVGSMLDAHPDVIIAHEADVLGKSNFGKTHSGNLQKYKLFYELWKRSQYDAMFGIHADSARLEAGPYSHSYHVPGQWQGTYRNTIKVMGDKTGDATARALQKEETFSNLDKFGALVGVPVKFIHITRNPFDNIATKFLWLSGKGNIAQDEKVNDEKSLNTAIQQYFTQAAANEKVRQKYGDAVISLPIKGFKLTPKKSLMELCEFLGITCKEDYLEACAKIMHGTPSITRDKVVWTKEQKRWVHNEMQKYSFLKEYTFDSP